MIVRACVPVCVRPSRLYLGVLVCTCTCVYLLPLTSTACRRFSAVRRDVVHVEYSVAKLQHLYNANPHIHVDFLETADEDVPQGRACACTDAQARTLCDDMQ
eukprot:GHVU01031989.1.p2 GENE.GHVU01031989.1~~GHVU01031989.1.p2  ORF type:complete len:102 (+),score=2.16 GHVU01031989.1:228-533(+)